MDKNTVSPAINVKSIREMIDKLDKDKLDKPALTMRTNDSYKTFSYRQMQRKIRLLGNALKKIGVKEKDHIGLISENRSEWILSYLAVTYIGAIIVPFDKELHQDELAHIIRSSDVKYIFSSEKYFDKLNNAIKYSDNIEKIILFDIHDILNQKKSLSVIKKILNKNSSINFKKEWKTLTKREYQKDKPFNKFNYLYIESLFMLGEMLEEDNINLYKDIKVDKNQTAAIIYTSGTTGLPKGVMLTHRNLVSNGDAIQQKTKAHPEDNWIIILPLHHTFPAIAGIFIPILTYANVTTVATLRSDIMLETMKETKVTIFPTVPLIVEKMYKKIISNVKMKPFYVRILFNIMYFISFVFYHYFDIRIGKYLFKSVHEKLGMDNFRFFIVGGGKQSPDIINGMAILGIDVYEGYGLTETSPVVATGIPENHKVGSVGLPLRNMNVKIKNPDEEGNGEILVKGECVMKGYYKLPDKTEEVFNEDGWFHTGDIGYIDDEGFLYITGRLKNVIVNKSGKNIYPEEIENKILKSEYIDEAVIIGKKDENNNEYPYAVIHPNMEAISSLEAEKNKTYSNDSIRDLISKEIEKSVKKLAYYKKPTRFEISYEELPKTSTNKVKRYLFE